MLIFSEIFLSNPNIFLFFLLGNLYDLSILNLESIFDLLHMILKFDFPLFLRILFYTDIGIFLRLLNLEDDYFD